MMKDLSKGELKDEFDGSKTPTNDTLKQAILSYKKEVGDVFFFMFFSACIHEDSSGKRQDIAQRRAARYFFDFQWETGKISSDELPDWYKEDLARLRDPTYKPAKKSPKPKKPGGRMITVDEMVALSKKGVAESHEKTVKPTEANEADKPPEVTTPAGERVRRKGVGPMSKEDNEQNPLASIFERADEIAAAPPRGRPAKGSEYQPKVATNARIDKDVIYWLKSKGPNHISRVNGMLKALKEADEVAHTAP